MLNNKRKQILLFFFLIIVLGLIVLFIPKEKEEEKKLETCHELKSYDNQKIFKINDKFTLAKKHSLNEKASLELENQTEKIYLVYLKYKPEDYLSFEDFSSQVIKDNQKTYATEEILKDESLKNLEGKTLEYEIMQDELQIFLKTFLYVDEDNYNEIIIWGNLDNKTDILKYFKTIEIK